MKLSNKLTLCLTFFILLAIAAVPVMAHNPPSGQTFAESHDGVRNDADQAANELAAESGHTHSAQPTITSIVAVDTKGLTPTVMTDNAADGTDQLVSNVDGTNVVLADKIDTDDATRLLVTVGTGGVFQVKVTFSDSVYATAAAAVSTAVPTVVATDLAASTFRVTAAYADAPGVIIVGPGAVTVTDVARVNNGTTAEPDFSLTEFLVTVTVAVNSTLDPPDDATAAVKAAAAAKRPLSIWIGVNANALYTKANLNTDGEQVDGRGNAASGNTKFSVNNYTHTPTVAPPSVDTDGPDIDTFTKPAAADSDGNLTFTLTFDQSLGPRGLRESDLDVTGGEIVSITPEGASDTYMIKIDPTATDTTEAEVIVKLIDRSVTDASGLPYVEPDTDVKMGIWDTVNPTVHAVATGVVGTGTGTGGNGIAVGMVKLSITFSEELEVSSGPDQTFKNEDIDRTNSNVLLTNTEPMLATMPEGNKTVYELTVTPVPANAGQVVILIGAGSVVDVAENPLVQDALVTWTRPGPPTADTTKPVVMLQNPKGPDAASATESPDDDIVIDESGGSITFTISDNTGGSGLATDAAVAMSEVSVSNGSVTSVSGNTITVNPMVVDGATVNTSVTVTVAAGAIADAAGNTNDAVSETYSIGPIFSIPVNTILVVTKTADMTYTFVSDQSRLPINQNPPTPVAEIEVAVWDNMPDLEVLFSFAGGGNGGTLNLIEAHRQADLTQKRDGDKHQLNSVRISEVMWASDLSKRGAPDDAEADEQWIEISNDTGAAVRVLMYARTGLDSAINVDANVDRVGNAYNGAPGSGGWIVPGQNGNSWTGVNFVSMHRSYTTGDSRGYLNGTSSGHWHASDREYLASASGNGEKLYHHVGSPGRPHSIGLPKPSVKAGRTAIPGSSVGENEKVVINEVANRSDKRYEWIELRNDGTQVADLRNFRISMVEATGTETELFRFAHNDAARIPVGGVLLLVATDPRYDEDHPIAVGYNVDKGDPDQVAGLGLQVDGSPRAPARYKVVNNFGEDGLPDSGKFVIIVRSPDNLENKGEGGKGWAELANNNLNAGDDDLDKITDIAGWTDVSLRKDNYPETNPANLNITHLWPLVNFGAPVNNKNSFTVDRVHYRQHVNTNDGRRGTGITHKDQKDGQIAWRDAGYSGIGYKRTARQLTEHNGTPGYHNNTVNTKANSSVMISEVMYSTGANGTLPQWIELYNSSATKAVHLGSGWRIRIETLDSSGNALTNLLTISFKDKGRVKYIYPQQTVLVAAGNARQAGSDFQPASVVFPETRLFNVSREYRGDGALKSDGFTNDRYMFFNPKAFHLALLDKDGALVDEVGNLDGDSRTNDTVTPDAEFPSAVGEDGRRSSIIRIYDDGTARAGMGGIMPIFKEGGNRNDTDGIDPKYSWIPAVNTGTEFKVTIRSTWYGDEDDYGTPGHRAGLVLPVQLSSFRPTLEDGVVTVRWTTESELDNAGFNIYRSETRDGEYKQVNTALIEGAGTTGERTVYSWVDQTAKPGAVYYYQIEDVSFAGDRQALAVTKLKGLISAKNKLTTTWSELKEASQ